MDSQYDPSVQRQDTTLERMQQERDGPRATSSVGRVSPNVQKQTSVDPSLSTEGGDLNTSDNDASRRGDVAADEPSKPLPAPPPQ